jgi:diguanylate cyclase (GGDEF)-like protein
MANERELSIQKEMAKLRSEFHDRLISELEDFVAYATLTDQEICNAATLKKLYEDSHRLAGSALTFGYTDTGALLRRLESALDGILNQGAEINVLSLRQQLKVLAPAVAIPAEMKNGVPTSATETAASKKVQPLAESVLLYVLENDSATSDLLKTGLSSFGYQLRAFTDIEALCEAALSELPNGLIVDIEKNNIADNTLATAARRLREHGMEAIPILVVSEHDSFAEKLEAARNSVVAFLSKPVNIPALESSLEFVLQPRAKSPYRVLLVDDDVYSMEHHRLMLGKWGIMAHPLSDPSKILDVIEEFHPDLMIFDLHMPSCTGVELAEVVRFHTHWLHIPIIFLSSERNERRQIAAMMTGGDDFIVKPVVEESFVATITGRAQRARQLAELMTRDSLTGLLKHTEIKERLGHEYARAGRNKSLVSVAMLDIDKFKRVNDTYGHQTGDVVIATLAHLLRRGLRTTDILGRYGGEEYMVVMPDTDAKNAAIKLNTLRSEFEKVTFRHNDEVFTCSFSGGICQSDQVKNIDEFVEQADMALFRAKERGRNQIVQADDTD